MMEEFCNESNISIGFLSIQNLNLKQHKDQIFFPFNKSKNQNEHFAVKQRF